MKRLRHNPVAEGFSAGVQIIRKLRTTEQLLNQGQSVADVCRALGVSPGFRKVVTPFIRTPGGLRT
ncbi:hypothetical protein KBY58_04395 [Cyanobium sp. HWJ4-Hawea]|uniref:hypothetical protein n=1 Tax=Cyanobium sp. HWJ4-Hawea TaxID=2823713 RepID=UPI0020CD35B6|nr:hypothetical protein [Cyanobium sp. HWJ4-Hawea]MCP9808669.1 hypothetical protein [Cyanobium sp. HWJ4-Hawea]